MWAGVLAATVLVVAAVMYNPSYFVVVRDTIPMARHFECQLEAHANLQKLHKKSIEPPQNSSALNSVLESVAAAARGAPRIQSQCPAKV